MPKLTVAATIFFDLIELNDTAVYTITQTFLSLLNIHGLNENAY
jgi:hypothetical protein